MDTPRLVDMPDEDYEVLLGKGLRVEPLRLERMQRRRDAGADRIDRAHQLRVGSDAAFI